MRNGGLSFHVFADWGGGTGGIFRNVRFFDDAARADVLARSHLDYANSKSDYCV